jgi:hypothetical protein
MQMKIKFPNKKDHKKNAKNLADLEKEEEEEIFPKSGSHH